MEFEEKDWVACCGSAQFAAEMAKASPFGSAEEAITAARDIWFNRVDVNGWLEAFAAHPQIGQFAAHPQIGQSPSSAHSSPAFAQWSRGEQSTATGSTLQELSEWNARYRQKFGFLFLICASGRSSAEILAELKKRYQNRPIVEFQIAAEEQMKVTELRIAKLLSTKTKTGPVRDQNLTTSAMKAEEDRVAVIGGHLTAGPDSSSGKKSQIPTRTRPPITTHVLDVSRGCPAAGVEVRLEKWKDTKSRPMFDYMDKGSWVLHGSSTTNADGRSGELMSITDALNPGIYRISFNTGKYCPSGFFPYVSLVFEIRESQTQEHFHVPLLLSPFSFTTYRGS